MPFLNLGVVPCVRSLSDAFGTTHFSSMERAEGFGGAFSAILILPVPLKET